MGKTANPDRRVGDGCRLALVAESLETFAAIQEAIRVVPLASPSTRVGDACRRGTARCMPDRVDRIVPLVAAGGRLTGMRCLTQSLTLARFLARSGIATDVRIGVRTDAGRLLAHASVESMGHPLNDGATNVQRVAAFTWRLPLRKLVSMQIKASTR
jgi:hypothetical protein